LARTRKLEVVLAGDAKGAVRAFDQAESRAGGFGGKMSKLGGIVAGAFKAAAVGAGVAAAGAGAAIFKIGTDYEDSLNLFQSVSRATAGEMDRVRAKAKELGNDLTLPGTSAGNAARAMTELTKAGISVNETLAASKGVLQLAAAAQVDEATAATITANSLNAFSLAGSEANRVADLLAAAANASSGEITDMADALKQSSAVFAKAGVPIEDLTTLIGQMANKGIQGSDAGTSLKTMMLSLQAPSNKAAGAIADLGVSIYDAQGGMRPMRDLIGQFSEKLAGLNEEQRNNALKDIFGTDAIRAANIVLGEGVAGFDKMKAAVTQQGAAANVAAAKNKGLRGALDGLRSQFETIAIEIYEKVGPALGEFVRGVSERVPAAFEAVKNTVGEFVRGVSAGLTGGLLGAVVRTQDGMSGFGAKVGEVFRSIRQWWDDNGPAVIAGLVSFKDGAVVVFQRVAQVVGQVVEVVGGMVASVRAWLDQNRATIDEWRVKLTGIFNNVWAVISGFVELVKVAWATFGQTLLDTAASVFGNILQLIDGSLRSIKGIIDLFVGLLTGDWSRAWEGIQGIVSGAWEKIKGVTGLALDVIKVTIGLAWDAVTAIFGGAWARFKEIVHIGALTIQERFLAFAGEVLKLAEKAFGWVPGIGPKLREASAAIQRFRDETNRELGQIQDKKITITVARIVNEHVNRPRAGDGPGNIAAAGKAIDRARAAATGLPVSMSSAYRTPARNRAVGGSPTSYHLDRFNPASDWVGPNWALDEMARRLRGAGRFRELLWRTFGHLDHLHYAHTGGMVERNWPTLAGLRSDERPAVLQVGERVQSRREVAAATMTTKEGETHVHFHIGTFVGGDERALAELWQRAKRKGYVGV
jgi:TP901 family phage tail tape measure protein